jgi:hypothetical protein
MSQVREVSIKVKVATIRDGTHGISLAMPDRLLGEWTDSGAVSLSVTDEHSIRIYGKSGDQRYLLTMPGRPLRGEQLSDTEAVIVICL